MLVRTAYAAAAVVLLRAVDCLRAMADSANVLTTTYPSGVLARAVMEAVRHGLEVLQPPV